MTRNQKIAAVCIVVLAALGLKSCLSSDEQTTVQVQPAPVVQQQAPQQVAVQPAPVQEEAPVYDQQQPNVVVVQQPPQQVVQQSSNNGFFHGMLMGHLLTRSHGGGYSSNRTVVHNHTTVVNRAPRIVQRPAPVRSRSYFGSTGRSSRSFSSFRSSRPSFGSRSRSFSRRR